MNTTNSKKSGEINIPVSTASSVHTGSHLTPIYLNLYDLGECINTCIDSVGLSYYHCAVQTHSTEYGYMGHPYRFTGLYKTSKHDPRFHLYRLRHSIEISWTWLNEKEIDQIFNDLKSFYLGFDYHTTKKNSIHFAKYLLQQLSNDLQLKHREPIKIIHFPSYVDRIRRLSETFEFLQIFDTEKEIAEINILYFLYMKYEGNIKQICQLLQFDTIDKLKRPIELIEQGIQQRKLPIFPLFTTFDIRRADDYLNSNIRLNNEQLTLTDIFHQFDTITLRGRTSIDRYLNIQRTNEQISSTHTDPAVFSPHTYRSSQPQSISQNQGQTPLISPSGSYRSGLPITSDNSPLINLGIPIPCLQESSNMKNDLSRTIFKDSKLRLIRNGGHNPYSLVSNQHRKFSSSSRQRKLPRDLELTNDLYTMTHQNLFRHNCTNNAFCSSHQSIISLEKILTNEAIDSSV